MALFRVLCWALIFVLRLRFPPGSSLGKQYVISYSYILVCRELKQYYNQRLDAFNINIDSLTLVLIIKKRLQDLCFLQFFYVKKAKNGQMDLAGRFISCGQMDLKKAILATMIINIW